VEFVGWLIIGVVVVTLLGVALWGALPFWGRERGYWAPQGHLPPGDEEFKKPRNEGDLL
jgi:hypothetical protein